MAMACPELEHIAKEVTTSIAAAAVRMKEAVAKELAALRAERTTLQQEQVDMRAKLQAEQEDLEREKAAFEEEKRVDHILRQIIFP